MPRPYEVLEEVVPGNARVLSCPVDILPPIAGWVVDASTAPWSGSTPTGPGTNKRAVFDTGAMHTVINRGLANQISLPRAPYNRPYSQWRGGMLDLPRLRSAAQHGLPLHQRAESSYSY